MPMFLTESLLPAFSHSAESNSPTPLGISPRIPCLLSNQPWPWHPPAKSHDLLLSVPRHHHLAPQWYSPPRYNSMVPVCVLQAHLRQVYSDVAGDRMVERPGSAQGRREGGSDHVRGGGQATAPGRGVVSECPDGERTTVDGSGKVDDCMRKRLGLVDTH